MAGFGATDVKDIQVLPSVVTTYDPVMGVGEISSTVTVEANSNAVNTDNGELSGTLDAVELSKLPTFSLSPFESDGDSAGSAVGQSGA